MKAQKMKIMICLNNKRKLHKNKMNRFLLVSIRMKMLLTRPDFLLTSAEKMIDSKKGLVRGYHHRIICFEAQDHFLAL
jgi:hypothetical protein